MKRHLVLPVVAAATAGLLLTSCSGGDSEPDDDIAGAQTSAPPEDDEPEEPEDDADAEADTDAPDDGIDRPEIDLPEDMTKEFEDVDTDDPDELAVLADQARYASAVDEAITKGEIGESLEFYAGGEGYITALDMINGYYEDGYSVGGNFVYFNRSVTMRGDGVATSSYCTDFSGAYTVDLESGEQYPESGEPYFYSFRQEINDQGVWQVVSWQATPEVASCD